MSALLLRFLCGLVGLLLCACSSDTARIEIFLNNLPTDAQSLVFELRPQGLPSRGLARLEGAQVRPHIELTVNKGLQGSEILQVRALDLAHCRIAEGQVQLSPGQKTATIDLSDTRATACLLRVSYSGNGQVLPMPGSKPPWASRVENQDAKYTEYRLLSGDAESVCPYRFRLAATPASDSYFVGWSLSCTGVGDCEPWAAACNALDSEESTRRRLVADGLTEVHASFVPLKQCGPSGFCWLNPQPHGFTLNAVTGLSPRDGWAVGDAGVVMRYNGSAWATLPASEVGSTAPLFGAWASSPNNLWLVGEKGTILHWNGRSFVRQAAGIERGLRGVWGDGRGAVFVVGLQGTVLQCREDSEEACVALGSEPSMQLARLSFSAVFGLGSDDVYFAAGDASSASGVLLHWDGQVITEVFRHLGGGFTSLWGEVKDGQRRLWLGTTDGRILQGDGRTFAEELAVPGARAQIQALDGRSSPIADGQTELWTVTSHGRAYRRTAQGWQEAETTTREWLLGVWVNDREVWAVGVGGLMVRWNGVQFVAAGDGKRGLSLGRSLTAGSDLYVTLDDSSLLHASNGYVESLSLPLIRLFGLLSVDNELLAASGNALMKYGTGSFSTFQPLGQLGAIALSGTSINDLWAVGGNASVSWYNKTMSTTYTGQAGALFLINDAINRSSHNIHSDVSINELERSVILQSVVSHHVGEFWAVGDGGIMAHKSQSAGSPTLGIQPFRNRLPTYYGIWGSGEYNLWVVGTSGAVLRLQGEQADWVDVSPCREDPNMPPREAVFLDVGGTGPNDVWIVGTSSRRLCDSVYHWDGQKLCAVPGMPKSLRWVAARGKEVYLVTDAGGILHLPNTDQFKCE